jgi:glycerophosphoryl diester phosphodiesterase
VITRRETAAIAALVAALAVIFSPVGSPVDSGRPFDLQAHRGGRGEATEESLGAFAHALEIGVTTLELDIVLSRDGHPMVWHDPTIQADKCADTAPAFEGDPQFPYVGKLVHDLDLAQLRTLDCGKLLKDFPDAKVIENNKIATLPEVFALADSYRADVRYNIETKLDGDQSASPREFVDAILAAVRTAGKTHLVEIQSFDWRTLPMVRAAEPAIPLVALWDQSTYVPGATTRFAGIDPAVVTDPITAAFMVGANIVSPGYYRRTDGNRFELYADEGFVARAHRLGLKVIPWTVNDAGAMRAQIAAGADGIITDFPTRLRSVMESMGLPLPKSYHRG